MKKQFKPVVLVENQHLVIRVNGVLHLKVAMESVIAFHSYKLSNDRWNIDICCKEIAPVELTYTTQRMWKQVLRGLDKIRIY